MSSAASRKQGGDGVRRQFPVGRRRYAPVVDAGCGCRPRLPSFLRSGSCHLTGRGGGGKTAARRRSGGERSSSPSTSAASLSSSSCAATRSTFSSSASDYRYYYPAAAAATKQPQQPPAAKGKGKGKKKKKEEEEEEEVGVAVEKESCDPRADFRESMVQMVVEMGLCDWDGLRCMLRRLLALNAPRHHAAILTAFADVCAQIIAADSPKPTHPRRP